jgi:hypothetical protein
MMGWLADVAKTGLNGAIAVGNMFDLPGSMVRDVIGGENPFDNFYSQKRGLGAIFSGENRLSGREMLSKRFGMKPNDPNKWEWQDPVGFGAEVLTDPMNWVGGGFLTKFLRNAKGIKKANAASEALRAKGAMPREISDLSMIKDASGDVPPMMYTGYPTGHPSGVVPGMRTAESGIHPAIMTEGNVHSTGMDGTLGVQLQVRPDSRVPFSTAKEYCRQYAWNAEGVHQVIQAAHWGEA